MTFMVEQQFMVPNRENHEGHSAVQTQRRCGYSSLDNNRKIISAVILTSQ